MTTHFKVNHYLTGQKRPYQINRPYRAYYPCPIMRSGFLSGNLCFVLTQCREPVHLVPKSDRAKDKETYAVKFNNILCVLAIMLKLSLIAIYYITYRTKLEISQAIINC